jgi:predicted dehydrogenase
MAHKPMYKQESVIEKVMLPIVEPLKRELVEFAEAIRDCREPLTSGKDAVNAMHYAEQVHELTKDCPKL